MNIKQKSNKFRSIVNDMADLYEKKNSNYGDSFGQLFEELGPTAGLVPLWNKLHRATSLIKGDKNNFESLEDTLKDLACYAIMNLIEMEAQKDKECCSVSALPEYTECEMYKLHKERTNSSLITTDCYGCKHISCPYYKSSYINLCGAGEPIKTAYGSTDPCEGCETQKMLSQGINYIGDLPCQWCSKNPLQLNCVNTTRSDGTTSTHTLSNRKGETNNEK